MQLSIPILKRFFTIFFLALFLFVVIAGLTTRFTVQKKTIQAITIGTTTLHVALAITESEKQAGLSGLPSLPEDQAMLFVFGTSGRHGFWMKDMHFPIDIIWLDGQRMIVHIEANVHPDSYPQIFIPTRDALYVLETVAGFSEKEKIHVGDQVQFLD